MFMFESRRIQKRSAIVMSDIHVIIMGVLFLPIGSCYRERCGDRPDVPECQIGEQDPSAPKSLSVPMPDDFTAVITGPDLLEISYTTEEGEPVHLSYEITGPYKYQH